MNQTELNNFAREHFDTYKKRQEGHIVHDPGTTLAHRTLVEKICEWAHIKRLFVLYKSIFKEWTYCGYMYTRIKTTFH